MPIDRNETYDESGTDKEKKRNGFEKPNKIDDVLKNELGEFGRFQLRNIFLVVVPIVMSAFKVDYVFTAATIPYRCRILECGENSKLHTYDPEWILNAVPQTKAGFSSCSRYAPNDIGLNGSLDYCPANLFDQAKTVGCDGFVYGKDNTIVYDFDLGCQEWLRALPGSLNSIGLFIGMPFSGYISDRFGRRIVLVLNTFGLGLVGVIRAFSVNYTMYAILQISQTILCSSIYAASLVLATELIGPKYRVVVSALLLSTFAVGQVLLGGLSWLIESWRYLTLTLYTPSLFIIVYYWLLSESFRWLIAKGKYAEARKVLESVARVNGKTISDTSMEALMTAPQASSSHLKETKFGLLRALFRTPILLRRVCTTPIWWISATFVYYGLSFNSTSLSSSSHFNYMLTCAVEIPSYVTGVLFVDRIGRKATIASGFFFSALCNVLFILIPQDISAARLIVYLLGKFGISMVMCFNYLYTSELYPTEYRHTFLAFSSMIGRIGVVMAPLTPVLKQYWHGLPSTLFASMGLLGGLLVLTQPETLGTKLPETLADAEMLGKSESRLSSKLP